MAPDPEEKARYGGQIGQSVQVKGKHASPDIYHQRATTRPFQLESTAMCVDSV